MSGGSKNTGRDMIIQNLYDGKKGGTAVGS